MKARYNLEASLKGVARTLHKREEFYNNSLDFLNQILVSFDYVQLPYA